MTSAIDVMIVDDHTIVRHGLRAYLDTVEDIAVVAEATDGRDAIDQLAKMSTVTRVPDVMLVDLQMPRMDGEQTTVEVARSFPSVRVVVMTSFSDIGRIHALLQAGASGYILKRSDESQIDAAIRAAHSGEVHLDPVVARVLTQTLMHRETPDLTAREIEVVRLLARGLSNEDIAHALTMSERTARTHVSNILMKLGLQSRTQAALWAIREGIATVD